MEKLTALKERKRAEMSTQEKLQFQPPHPLDEKEKQFLQSLKPQEKELHALATQMLGSSYFVGKTHGFTQWVKSNPKQQPPATN